ncbi:MAG: NAD-binding protein [Micromonosporaceae bacterium]|nr:NAD-binding protein [Micromonosporaceae bacterium]
MATVAVVGTGRMGAAMAVRLAGAGHELVLFNRTRSRADELAGQTGARVAGTAAEAAGGAELVLVSLADDAAVSETYHGPDGLAAGLGPGVVVLESSTIAPATVRALAPLVGERGAALLDTPVSGSVPVVQRGELTVLAGGDAAALARARPALDSFARHVFHLGPLGAGATMKLAVNSVVYAINQAVSEALVLAEKAGVDRAAAYQVFAGSVAGAPFLDYKRDAFLEPATTPVAFTLALVAKDLELIGELASQVGARMDLAGAGRALVAEAVAAGYGDRDLSALAVLLRG